MERRTFLATLAGSLLAAPLAAEAQPAGRVARIGYLGQNSPSAPAMPSNLRDSEKAYAISVTWKPRIG